MPKPTTLKGWWLLLLQQRANNNVALLASLVDTTTRTLGRWASDEIKLPDKHHRILLRQVAGEELLNHPDCPKYLRKKPKHVR